MSEGRVDDLTLPDPATTPLVQGGPVSGDDDRLEQLARRHVHRVLGYLLRRCSAADAADIWQQVITITWQRLDKVPSTDEDALAWLIGTARRCHGNHRRGEKRRSEATERLIDTIRTASPIGTPHDSAVRSALNGLRSSDQELLRLKYWDELTTDQIAAVLNLKPATGRKRLQRARQVLQQRLDTQHRTNTGHAEPTRADSPTPS